MYKLYSDFNNLRSAANVLNNIFGTHISSNDFDYSGHSHTCNSDDWPFTVTPYDVYVALSTCKASKAAGSDLIPTILYKSAASFIAEPLCHIFNLSIETVTFPDIWKLSYVNAIPKCHKPSIHDARPISLLPLPSIAFEKCVHIKSLKDVFCSKFKTSQFGFRPDSSTCCALIYLHNFITNF